jgi:hypothetical protein
MAIKEKLNGYYTGNPFEGNRTAVADELECFGFLAVHEEEPQRAAALLGAAEALREKNQSPMADYERVEYDQRMAQLCSMLPAAELNGLWAQGRSMTMAQAIELAVGNP